MAVSSGTRVRDAWRRPGARRFSRYAVGSVVAFGASNVVFLLCYGTGWTSPQVASVLAFAAGIPINYVLNRRWAWQRRGRPAVRSELLPYAAVVSLSIVATAVGTWGADRMLAAADLGRALTVVLVDGGHPRRRPPVATSPIEADVPTVRVTRDLPFDAAWKQALPPSHERRAVVGPRSRH